MILDDALECYKRSKMYRDKTGSNMKTPEEILRKVEREDTERHFPSDTFVEDGSGGTRVYYRSDLVLTAMQAYADQQVKVERNKAIQECINALEQHQQKVGTGDDYSCGVANSINILESLKIKQP